MSDTRIFREEMKWWVREIGYPVEVLRSAARRGELKAERPSGFERGRLYISNIEMQRWLDTIQVDA